MSSPNTSTLQKLDRIQAPRTNSHEPFRFWSTIFSFVTPYRKQMVIATLCSLLVGAAVALQPICIKWIVDNGFMRKALDGTLAPSSERIRYTLYFIGLYLFLSISRITIWTFGYRMLIQSIESVFRDLRRRFFSHIQDLCFRFHDQMSSGELYNYIMGSPIASLKTFLQQFSMHVPYQLVSLVIATTALATFNWVMTIITLSMIVIIVYINFKSRAIIKEVSSKFMETESNASKHIADMLRGCRAIKIHAMEENTNFSFEVHVDRIRKHGVIQSIRHQIEGIKAEIVQYIGMAIIYLSGGYFCIYGDMELGTFFAFITSISVMMGPIMSMMQVNLIRGNAEAGMERITRIMQIQKSTPERHPEAQLSYSIQREIAQKQNVPCLEFKDVYFSYDDKTPTLNGVSCTIHHGESVALVGPSGSGKTTFVSLIQRLYDIQKGQILLNGQDIRDYSLKSVRSAFGTVSQSPFMFQDTVLNNIKITNPDASEEDIQAAIQMAYINEFIDQLPNGLQTLVGEDGYGLSGGQRQRVAIARALLSKPDYFIFDEATSALDNQSERKIQTAMEELMKTHTTFIIAHRLSTIRNVDKILVFKDGRISQCGTYDELAGQDGLFKELLSQTNNDILGTPTN